jgi:hypothetical protein
MKNALRVNLRMDPVTHKRLLSLSGTKFGDSMSEVIRNLIDRAFEELKQPEKEIQKDEQAA